MDELSDAKIRNATPLDKEYAIADGQGLSVVVRPNGTKLWLYRYRFGGKRKNMSFGTFPGVGLKAARESATARKSCSIRAKIRSQCARPSDRKTKSSHTHIPCSRGRMGDHEARKREQGQVDDQAGTLEPRSAQS